MLTRTLVTRQWRILRPVQTLATRTFTTSRPQRKAATETVTDTVKDAAKAVDRTVSKVAIKGLEGVEKVNDVVRDAAERVGIKSNQKVDEFEVGAKAMKTKAEVKGDQMRRDAEQGVKQAADAVKDTGS